MPLHQQTFLAPPDSKCRGRPRDPRGNGKNDPEGGLPNPPASLRGACDAPASRRAPRLAGLTRKAIVYATNF